MIPSNQSKRNFRPIGFSLFLMAGLLTSSKYLMAQGDLLIYPKRIIFDGSKRAQDLSLVNNGQDTARYSISVVEIRMKEDGSFENILQPDPGQNFADKNIRFFPRSVVLGPKEVQTVKIQLLGFSQLAEGEYRSHLYFRADPEGKQPGNENPAYSPASLSIQITPIYGISIPVLIRSGASTTEISLSKVSFHLENDTLPLMDLHIDRSGNMSIYGDITVDYVSAQGKETRVGQVKGVAVYTPNATRRVRLTLNRNASVDYHQGALHVVFTETSGQTQKVAQQQISLQ